MPLLVYFGLLLAVLAITTRRSPALILLAIYALSVLCGVVLGVDYHVPNIGGEADVVFVLAMVTLMILPWSFFPFGAPLAEPASKRLRRLTIILLAIHAVGFVIFSTIFYSAFTTITDYSAFKNGGEAAAFYGALPINHTLLLIWTYLNPSAVFLIPLHFYYLMKQRTWLSLLCLLFSFNYVLEGISTFSRTVLLVYIVFYLLYLAFFYRRFERRQRRVLNAVGVVAVALFAAVFYQITTNRFARYLASSNSDAAGSVVGNPVVYSVLDYASQWYRNGNDVMARYSFATFHGGLSFPLVTTIANKMGATSYSPDAVSDQLEAAWGDRYDKFVGLVPNLVFDFGYAGTVIFTLCYAIGLWEIRPRRGSMSVATLLVLGPIFALPAMGTQNSLMKSDSYNLMVVYSLAVYAYLYTRARDGRVRGDPRDGALGAVGNDNPLPGRSAQ